MSAELDTGTREGDSVLKMSYSGNGGRFRYYPQTATGVSDYSDKQLISFIVMSDNPNLTQISVFLLTSAGGQYRVFLPITHNAPTKITVDITALKYVSGTGAITAIDKSIVREIRFVADNNKGSGIIYLDDIKII